MAQRVFHSAKRVCERKRERKREREYVNMRHFFS